MDRTRARARRESPGGGGGGGGRKIQLRPRPHRFAASSHVGLPKWTRLKLQTGSGAQSVRQRRRRRRPKSVRAAREVIYAPRNTVVVSVVDLSSGDCSAGGLTSRKAPPLAAQAAARGLRLTWRRRRRFVLARPAAQRRPRARDEYQPPAAVVAISREKRLLKHEQRRICMRIRIELSPRNAREGGASAD